MNRGDIGKNFQVVYSQIDKKVNKKAVLAMDKLERLSNVSKGEIEEEEEEVQRMIV
jgi:hypothetical protein